MLLVAIVELLSEIHTQLKDAQKLGVYKVDTFLYSNAGFAKGCRRQLPESKTNKKTADKYLLCSHFISWHIYQTAPYIRSGTFIKRTEVALLTRKEINNMYTK